jgi:hypothetical protein
MTDRDTLIAETEKLLKALLEWDMLRWTADGHYWKSEIERVLTLVREDGPQLKECSLIGDDESPSNAYVAACGTKFSTYEEMAHHSKKHEADGPRHEPVQTAEEEKTLSRVERCEGRYPVPQTSPPREEPFEVTYRCGLAQGHLGPHGCEPPVDGPHHEQDRPVIEAFVARVNARAEADMLTGNPVTGAHHRALEAELKALHAEPDPRR